nr:hypothetical protein CTI12_AA466230 [Tanacetum cinerariifolium]
VRDDELIVKNGSVVVVENENGHVEEITGEEVVKSIVQVVDANGIADVEMKMDDVEYEVIVDLKSTLNATESSQVNGFMLCEELNGQSVLMADVVNTIISTPDLVSTDIEVIVNDEPKSASTLVDETEKPSEDLQVKVAADAVATKDDLPTSPDPVENTDSQAIVNNGLRFATSALINEAKCQVTVVEPFEEVQVKAHVS